MKKFESLEIIPSKGIIRLNGEDIGDSKKLTLTMEAGQVILELVTEYESIGFNKEVINVKIK